MDLEGRILCQHVGVRASPQPTYWPRHLPAESFGETGVAYGALATLLACRAVIRGYNWGQPLILCSDNLGERALLTLQPIN